MEPCGSPTRNVGAIDGIPQLLILWHQRRSRTETPTNTLHTLPKADTSAKARQVISATGWPSLHGVHRPMLLHRKGLPNRPLASSTDAHHGGDSQPQPLAVTLDNKRLFLPLSCGVAYANLHGYHRCCSTVARAGMPWSEATHGMKI